MPIFLPGPIFGFGYGGDSYGYSPYGAPAFPRLPVPTTGGYGGAPFGHSSYGSVDITPPRVTSVQSLDGFRVEVFFSEEMDTASVLGGVYTFAAVFGVTVTSVAVTPGTAGALGLTSAIVAHTGTTLGGSYVLTASGPTDAAGNPLGPPPVNSAGFLAYGDVPRVEAQLPTIDDGRTVEAHFFRSDDSATQTMLPEVEYTPGIDDPSSYSVSTSYPVTPTLSSAELQAPPNNSIVLLDVHPMTSTSYDLLVGPSKAFSYTGNVLPSADPDPNITAIEEGVGSSSPSSAGLLLSKAVGDSYGWVFGDSSGRLVPGTSFSSAWTFDVSTAVIAPPIVGAPTAVFAVCDGGVQINILLNDLAGTKVIDVRSPGLIAQAPAEWDSGPHTLSLIRNIKGGFYSVLLDGTPLLSFLAGAALGLPIFPVGAPTGNSLTLPASGSAVSLFKVQKVTLTASDTVFTTAWNFVHGVVSSFTGSAVLTRDNLYTDRGPLVRGWGDATPAKKEDVSIELNGVGVTVRKVNPYHGQIFPEIPIPLTAKPSAAVGTIGVGPFQPLVGAIVTVNGVSLHQGAFVGWANGADIYETAAALGAAIAIHCGVAVDVMGSLLELSALTVGIAGNSIGLANTSADANIAISGATLSGGINEMVVSTDYIWFANPPLEFAGLNTMGLTLNKWDRAVGHTAPPVSPTMTGSGTPNTGRFPMGLLLAPMERKSPIKIGHRYHGLQRDYSALLNEPTSLLLNINPHSVSLGGVSATAIGERGYFSGDVDPALRITTPWVAEGVVQGELVTSGWTLTDATSGSYDIGFPALYSREADLSLPTECLYFTRLRVDSYTADGVFTGIGFGVHDNNHLVMAGFVVVDGIRHLGLLKDAEKTHLEEGWELGPKAMATGLTPTTISIPHTALPTGLHQASGSDLTWTKFRIPSGVQAGVYQIAACGMELDADGNVEITLVSPLAVNPTEYGAGVFEVLFDVPWDSDFATYQLRSSFPSSTTELYVGGLLSGMVVSITEAIPYPADTALVLPEGDEGVFFWGSVSRLAMSVSTWGLAQYSSAPLRIINTVKGIDVFTEMGKTPQEETHNPWFIAGGFGFSEVDATGDTLLLSSTSASVTNTPNLEFGYARIEPYLTPQVTTDLEAAFLLETASLGAGAAQLRIQDTEREVRISTLCIEQLPKGSPHTLRALPAVSISGLQDPTAEGWTAGTTNNLTMSIRGQLLSLETSSGTQGFWSQEVAPPPVTDEGLITQMRVGVESYSLGSTPYLGVFVGGSAVQVAAPSTCRNVSTILAEIGGVPSVALVDNAGTLVGSFAFDFTDGEIHTYRTFIDPEANIVVLKVDDVVVGNVPFSDFSATANNVACQFGIMGTASVKSVWDSVTALPLRAGGHLSAATYVRTFGIWNGGPEQDINSYIIPRTDGLSVPNSDLQAVFVEMDWRSSCRVRAYLDPAWGVGLYRPDLPLPPWATEDFATETTDPSAAWANLEYSQLPHQEEERGIVSFGAIDPQGVSQQRWDSVRYRIRAIPTGYGIAPQGMVLNRATPLTSGEFLYDTTPEVVTVRSLTTHTVSVWSSNMIADRVFVVVVDGVVIPSTRWAFEPSTQIIVLLDSLLEDRYPVTVTFAPGKPVTDTYLCSQPISGSVTLLNEGTPPIPLSRDSSATRSIVAGSIINDPLDVLDDASTLITNDPKRTVEFSLGPDALYADLDTCEVTDGESVHITTLCDAPGPGMGFSALEIDGPFVNNAFTVPGGPAGPHKGSPSIKGSATHFNPAVIFMASGGGINGGNLGPGTAILHPNQRGPTHMPPPGGFGINQDFGIALTDVTPRMDEYAFPAGADNTTPSGATGNGGYGAADAVLEDFSLVASHLGPAGGLSGLIAGKSLLAGGAPLNGGEFTLIGGALLPAPVLTTYVLQHP